MTTVFMSMAARSSNRDNFEPETKIQIEGHTLTPTGGQNGPEDPDAFGSTPSHSPSWSTARTPAPNWPETWYCLEIQVVSTEDDKATPPLTTCMATTDSGRYGLWRKNQPNRSHSDWPRKGYLVLWTLFIRRRTEFGQSLRDTAMFTLSGIIAWVGEQAQISAKPHEPG